VFDHWHEQFPHKETTRARDVLSGVLLGTRTACQIKFVCTYLQKGVFGSDYG